MTEAETLQMVEELDKQLDEWDVPRESGGFPLNPLGRVRLLYFIRVTEENRWRGRATILARQNQERIASENRSEGDAIVEHLWGPEHPSYDEMGQ